MRREDIEKLDVPYPEGGVRDERFGNALGVTPSAVRELQREVFGDFDERVGGVGWWAPHPGTSRRILISDHLLQCIASIETNLVEARLHLLETFDFDDRESDFNARTFSHDHAGRPSVAMPQRVRPADDIPLHMSSLHIAGFFRAVGSALDCLGAGIVGVLALPTSILKADIDRANKALRRVGEPTTAGAGLQAGFNADLTRLVHEAGPGGWLPWTIDYRNMLVHRGRRMESPFFSPRGALLYASDGRPVVVARTIRLLAQDPALSDVEALAAPGWHVLSEDAETTLEGILASTLKLIEGVASALLVAWAKRRARPELLPQPVDQWKDGRSSESRGFAGYEPDSIQTANAIVAHPTFIDRLKTASLTVDARQRWDNEFD